MDRRRFLTRLLAGAGTMVLGPSASARARDGRRRDFVAGYRRLARSGELDRRCGQAADMLRGCRLCPRQCGVDRTAGERGFCRAPGTAVVYSAHPHFGEEASLVGRRGSGTVFFSHCNLRCVFCQNWTIAHEGHGRETGDDRLAEMMLDLQRGGCHNINLVTPTHVMPRILKAVRIAAARGLSVPLVYNTSGYERLEVLRLLDGVVDIYLPDLKFMNSGLAETYLGGAGDYPETAQSAIAEMHRQVGRHQTDATGLALRGVMIRHLVMPNHLAGTRAFTRWVAERLAPDTYVNIMAQYHPAFRADEHPLIWRRINVGEYLAAMEWARRTGLTNLDPESLRLRDHYLRQREKAAG